MDAASNLKDAPPSEREVFESERAFKERDRKNEEARIVLQREELALKKEEGKASVSNNPLSLAIIGATIAAIANVWVAYYNGGEQRLVEKTKAESDLKLERQKAEDTRIVSAITGETAKATERLRFLLDTHLISDPDTRKYIETYINTPQIINPPAKTPPPASNTTRRVTIDSGWRGGGSNQTAECGQLQAQVQTQNPGQDVKLVGTSESSNKDFLGHVTYNYHCTFDIAHL